jgi:urease accessory protein
MMFRSCRTTALALVLLAAAQTADAHPFIYHTAGFSAGLLHPYTGLDHVLAMVAVGLWAAQVGGAFRWQAPLAFMGMMAAGSAAGMAGLALPWSETGIAASVLALGLLLSFAVRLPAALGMALAGMLAVFHGAAHGAELPQTASPVTYALGFLLATGSLHAVGLAAGAALQRKGGTLIRVGGAATAAIGAWLLLGA